MMKAIVLSAGQGRRLLPLTEEQPKCLLPVDTEETLLGFQLRALARCGVSRAVVVIGFGADEVEGYLATHPVPGLAIETLYNPFYGTSDNLVTCWLARSAMEDDFLLLNGDTLFEDAVLERVLDGPPVPLTVTIDHKSLYDDDDMKVSLDAQGRLLAIGKTLAPPEVGAESIGMLAFRGSGPKLFVDALERAVRRPESLRRWYLSVVHEMAQNHAVETMSIQGLWWGEVDSPEDLHAVRSELETRVSGRR
jgi:choline kinase